MSTCFVAKARFSTSPLITRRLNLDALLAHLLYRNYVYDGEGDEDAVKHAHDTIPLDIVADTFCGSSALMPVTPKIEHVFIQSLDSHINTWLNPADYVATVEKKRQDSSRYPESPTAILRRVGGTMLAARELPLYFMGKGDIDKVRQLLKQVKYLGKKRNSGYGRLSHPLEVTEVQGYMHFGVVSRDKILLRPIAESAFATFQPKTYDLAFDAIKPPYWDTEKVGCYVPKYNSLPPDLLEDMIEDAN